MVQQSSDSQKQYEKERSFFTKIRQQLQGLNFQNVKILVNFLIILTTNLSKLYCYAASDLRSFYLTKDLNCLKEA